MPRQPKQPKRKLHGPISLYPLTLDQIIEKIRRFKPEKKTPTPKKRKRKGNTSSTR